MLRALFGRREPTRVAPTVPLAPPPAPTLQDQEPPAAPPMRVAVDTVMLDAPPPPEPRAWEEEAPAEPVLDLSEALPPPLPPGPARSLILLARISEARAWTEEETEKAFELVAALAPPLPPAVPKPPAPPCDFCGSSGKVIGWTDAVEGADAAEKPCPFCRGDQP